MKYTILKKCWCYLFVFSQIFSCGCMDDNIVEDQDVIKEDLSAKQIDIDLYVLGEVKAGKYEPQSGIYTGAFVQKDPEIQGDIVQYETLIEQKQTFKVFNYKASVGIAKQEILKCIAQKKIPYIKLLLGNNYDLTPIYQLIFDIRDSYSTPIFIELYPLTEKEYVPEKYKETYQRAYEIIHKYLEDVVIVWSCDDSRVTDWPLYYPGDPYLDWGGINIYIPRYKGETPYYYSNYEKLDYWYKCFQDKKPLLISGLAVSHFSRVDHAYTIEDTVKKLNLFYRDTLQAYPRLKGIIYMDVDMGKIGSNGKEDYTITRHDQLIQAMKTLSVPLIINERLVQESPKESCYQKYSIEAVSIDETIYIPQEYMALCFSKIPLRKVRHLEDLSQEVYYNYEDIQSLCTTFYEA